MSTFNFKLIRNRAKKGVCQYCNISRWFGEFMRTAQVCTHKGVHQRAKQSKEERIHWSKGLEMPGFSDFPLRIILPL